MRKDEWHATHRTKPLAVMIVPEGILYRAMLLDVCERDCAGMLCTPAERALLFEPLPKPAKPQTVTVPTVYLKNLLACFEILTCLNKPVGYGELKAAVDAKKPRSGA